MSDKSTIELVWNETTSRASSHPAFSDAKQISSNQYVLRYPFLKGWSQSHKAERKYLDDKLAHLRSFGIVGTIRQIYK